MDWTLWAFIAAGVVALIFMIVAFIYIKKYMDTQKGKGGKRMTGSNNNMGMNNMQDQGYNPYGSEPMQFGQGSDPMSMNQMGQMGGNQDMQQGIMMQGYGGNYGNSSNFM